MAKLLFNLHQVPGDEALEVRQLLTDHSIAFYETSAGFFGTGSAALWLSDDAQWEEARELISTYQTTRTATARAEYQQHQPTLLEKFKQHPIKLLAGVVLIGVVLFISIVPFLELVDKHG